MKRQNRPNGYEIVDFGGKQVKCAVENRSLRVNQVITLWKHDFCWCLTASNRAHCGHHPFWSARITQKRLFHLLLALTSRVGPTYKKSHFGHFPDFAATTRGVEQVFRWHFRVQTACISRVVHDFSTGLPKIIFCFDFWNFQNRVLLVAWQQCKRSILAEVVGVKKKFFQNSF